jgi:hypothetical protein
MSACYEMLRRASDLAQALHKHGTGTSVSIKVGEFLDFLSDLSSQEGFYSMDLISNIKQISAQSSSTSVQPHAESLVFKW